MDLSVFLLLLGVIIVSMFIAVRAYINYLYAGVVRRVGSARGNRDGVSE